MRTHTDALRSREWQLNCTTELQKSIRVSPLTPPSRLSHFAQTAQQSQEAHTDAVSAKKERDVATPLHASTLADEQHPSDAGRRSPRHTHLCSNLTQGRSECTSGTRQRKNSTSLLRERAPSEDRPEGFAY